MALLKLVSILCMYAYVLVCLCWFHMHVIPILNAYLLLVPHFCYNLELISIATKFRSRLCACAFTNTSSLMELHVQAQLKLGFM